MSFSIKEEAEALILKHFTSFASGTKVLGVLLGDPKTLQIQKALPLFHDIDSAQPPLLDVAFLQAHAYANSFNMTILGIYESVEVLLIPKICEVIQKNCNIPQPPCVLIEIEAESHKLTFGH